VDLFSNTHKSCTHHIVIPDVCKSLLTSYFHQLDVHLLHFKIKSAKLFKPIFINIPDKLQLQNSEPILPGHARHYSDNVTKYVGGIIPMLNNVKVNQ